MADHVLNPEAGQLKFTGIPVSLRVTRRTELRDALQQRERPVVIDNDELAKPFARLAYWKEARWWFIAALIYKLIASSIAQQYAIEADWHMKWSTKEIGGKITLTPTEK